MLKTQIFQKDLNPNKIKYIFRIKGKLKKDSAKGKSL